MRTAASPRFPLAGDDESGAYAINDRGVTVGISTRGAVFRAVVWHGGAPIALPGLGGSFDNALDINNRGEIVGGSRTDARKHHAVLWRGGAVTDLGTLGGDVSLATAINNVGQIVGESTTATGETHAFVWKDGVMTDLGTLGGREPCRSCGGRRTLDLARTPSRSRPRTRRAA